MPRKLRRINKSAIAGVCSGFAYWLEIPTWIVRVLWLMSAFAGGTGIVIYLILAIFMPRWKEDPQDYDELCC